MKHYLDDFYYDTTTKELYKLLPLIIDIELQHQMVGRKMYS